jgi:hypothetical protein
MNLQELVDFFIKKPGYLKWGIPKLLNFLDIEDEHLVRKAKKESKKKLHTDVDDTRQDLQLKSRWQVQRKGGEVEWLESYKTVDEPDYQLTKEDWQDILNECNDIPVLEPQSIYVPSNNKTLVVWTSDKHIGASIPDDALYKKKYDKHIFFQRMKHVLEYAVKMKNLHGRFDKIVIADLGDSLDGYDGYTTRGGHKLPQNLNNKEAARVHFNTHKWFIESIINQDVADSIDVIHITNDNHSGDFGWQASFALQQYASIAYPTVNFSIVEEFLSHMKIYDRIYILTHGKDKKNRRYPLPLKIDDKTEGFIMDYVLSNKLANYDIHVRKGDIHLNDLDCSRNKMSYWNIGSIFGASDWIMDNFSDTKPSCVFEIIEKNNKNLNAEIVWL